MVAYTFKPRFVLPIELGEKRQTIRRIGKKRHARPGETVQIYTGPRMKPRKVGEATCQDTGEITFDFQRGEILIDWNDEARERDRFVTDAERDDFAALDGFADWQALVDFWAETHDVQDSWTGVIVRWGDTFRGGLALNPPAGD